MAHNPMKEIIVFISSPGDVKREKLAVLEGIEHLNSILEPHLQAHLKPIGWEDIPPGTGADVQAYINQHLPPFDIYVGIFNARLGTPTPRAPSGTVEEYQAAKARADAAPRSVHILVYFNTSKLERDVDILELQKLRDFKNSIKKTTLYGEFGSLSELKTKIEVDLSRTISKIPEIPLVIGQELRIPPIRKEMEEANTALLESSLTVIADFETLVSAFVSCEAQLAGIGESEDFKGNATPDSRAFRNTVEVVKELNRKLEEGERDFVAHLEALRTATLKHTVLLYAVRELKSGEGYRTQWDKRMRELGEIKEDLESLVRAIDSTQKIVEAFPGPGKLGEESVTLAKRMDQVKDRVLQYVLFLRYVILPLDEGGRDDI